MSIPVANLRWQARAEALPPAGVVAQAAVAQRLLRELSRLSDTQLQALSFVATRDLLVLLGSSANLPWVDGVRYCAPDLHAPLLWLPTHCQPALPTDLLQSALQKRVKRGGPILFWHEPEQLLPLDQSHILDVSLLPWLGKMLEAA